MNAQIKGLFVTILILFTACTRGEVLSPAVDTHLPPTKVLEVTLVPTSTITPILPEASATPYNDIGVIQNCFVIQSNLPNSSEYKGYLVFEYHEAGKNLLSLFDLQKGTITNIPGKANTDISVSPNHKYAAYESFDQQQLKVISANEKEIKSIPWEKHWGNIVNWLDNSHIQILMSEPDPINPNNPLFEKYPPSITLVDPFIDQTQTLESNYPDIDVASPGTSWGTSGITIYSSDLKRVVYPGSIQTVSREGYILYGIPENRILAQLPSIYWNNPPVWSPYGSQFIVMGQDEFYLIQYDGTVTKTTHMNPDYDGTNRTNLQYSSDSYFWSPDGHHVALWLYSLQTKKESLAILDIQTGVVIDTCIPGSNDRTLSRSLVWSPDGKAFVASTKSNSEDVINEVTLIDIENKAAFKLMDDNYPAGWLTSSSGEN